MKNHIFVKSCYQRNLIDVIRDKRKNVRSKPNQVRTVIEPSFVNSNVSIYIKEKKIVNHQNPCVYD